jgi:hypothetical protein
MAQKKPTHSRAKQLAKRLENNPELLERFESILELAESDEARAFDEVEQLLIEQVRALGNETLGQYASRCEQRLGEQMREQPGVQQREKKR